MAPEHWDNRMSRILGAWIGVPGQGRQALLLMVNARDMNASFQLPPGRWVCELDSTQPDGRSDWGRDTGSDMGHDMGHDKGRDGHATYILPSRSVVLLRDDSAS
jgi:glycogen operon protein